MPVDHHFSSALLPPHQSKKEGEIRQDSFPQPIIPEALGTKARRAQLKVGG